MKTGLHVDVPKYRAVLITGGTRGIGQAAVSAFARAGYRVAFCYRESEYRAAELTRTLQNEGHDVCGFCCDVGDPDALERLYGQTKRTFGSVDTLVCNAGAAHKRLIADETKEDIRWVLDVNLTSAIHLARLYTPDMVHAEFGRIVNVSSVYARTGASMESVYAAAKGGVESFTKSLAKELGPSGITANVVAPGLIDTNMNVELSQAEREAFLETAALNRAGTPEEVAALILFLASESASYLTGQVIGVDGGL